MGRDRATPRYLLTTACIPDEAYEAGVHHLERELGEETVSHQRADHLCLLTIRGEKPSRGSA